MNRKEAIFFISAMIVALIISTFIIFVSYNTGIPYLITLLACSTSGFVMAIIGKKLYIKYK